MSPAISADLTRALTASVTNVGAAATAADHAGAPLQTTVEHHITMCEIIFEKS